MATRPLTMTDVDFKLDLLIEPEQLVPYLGHELIRIIDLSRASVYEQLHIPHAIHLQPKYLVAQQEQEKQNLCKLSQNNFL